MSKTEITLRMVKTRQAKLLLDTLKTCRENLSSECIRSIVYDIVELLTGKRPAADREEMLFSIADIAYSLKWDKNSFNELDQMAELLGLKQDGYGKWIVYRKPDNRESKTFLFNEKGRHVLISKALGFTTSIQTN